MLNATNATANLPARGSAAMSARTVSTPIEPGFAERMSSIAVDASMPHTFAPRRTSGIPSRPVPTPSSRIGPPAARSNTVSTVASTSEMVEYQSSYTSAKASP